MKRYWLWNGINGFKYENNRNKKSRNTRLLTKHERDFEIEYGKMQNEVSFKRWNCTSLNVSICLNHFDTFDRVYLVDTWYNQRLIFFFKQTTLNRLNRVISKIFKFFRKELRVNIIINFCLGSVPKIKTNCNLWTFQCRKGTDSLNKYER